MDKGLGNKIMLGVSKAIKCSSLEDFINKVTPKNDIMSGSMVHPRSAMMVSH